MVLLLLLQISAIIGSSSAHGHIETATLQVRLHLAHDSYYDRYNEILILAQNTDCYKCSLIEIGRMEVSDSAEKNVTLYSNHSTLLRVVAVGNDTSEDMCRMEQIDVLEKSFYIYHVAELLNSPNCSCKLVLDTSGQDAFLPILYAFISLVGLCLVWIIVKFLYKRGMFHKCINLEMSGQQELIQDNLGSSNTVLSTNQVSRGTNRLKSLDAFRGLSLIVMVFVNYGGGGYWFFAHSAWNGLTVADLVFPWFIFIMGTAMAIVFNSRHRRGKGRFKWFVEISIRSARLFVLGLMVNSAGKHGNDLSKLRVTGVLQRFALTYLVVGLTELILSSGYKQTHVYESPSWFHRLADLYHFWPNWVVAMLCLTVHLIVTYAIPYNDNCPVLLVIVMLFWNFSGGNILLCENMYQCPGHDPEGILGCLSSIFLCFLGVQAGRIKCIYTSNKDRIIRWFVWSLFLGVLAVILCGASQNSGPIPLNKNLWSASFVIAQAASANFILAVFYWVIDVKHYWSGAPFIYPGKNSIFVYVGSEMLEDNIPISFAVNPHYHISVLFMNLWSVTFWILLSAYMYYKKIFISV